MAKSPEFSANHAALSRIARSYDYDMETARKEQQLASTSAPGDSTIRASAALLALNSGDFDETIRLGEEAALGDPVNLQTKMVLGYGYLYTGRIDEAMSVYREVIALNPLVDPVQFRLGQALLISGDFDAALEAMNKTVRDGLQIYRIGRSGKSANQNGAWVRLLILRSHRRSDVCIS